MFKKQDGKPQFEQDRFLVRLQQRVLREAAVSVCFLSGSYGKRREDGFSDMDVALLFRDESGRELAWSRRREFIQSVMPYVPAKSFDADHIRPFFHIALYGNGAKVDYRYETLNNLHPNPWDAEIKILKDSNGWAEQFQQQSASLPFPTPRITLDELTSIDNRFWVMFMDVLRLVARGDTDKPFAIYLELLGNTLPPLLNALPPEEPARRGLQTAVFTHDAKATAKQLGQLMSNYLAARTAVNQRHNLHFTPNNSFENQIRQIVQRLTR